MGSQQRNCIKHVYRPIFDNIYLSEWYSFWISHYLILKSHYQHMCRVKMNGFAAAQLETLIRSSHVKRSTAVTKESFLLGRLRKKLQRLKKFKHNFKLNFSTVFLLGN